MANSNFVVQNGLTAGPATIFAGNGDVVSGGNITVIGTGSSVSKLVVTNFSTGNAIITGGNTTSMTAGSFTTLQGTNLSTGNAQITGGAITNTTISGAAGNHTTLVVTTGFSTANAQITRIKQKDWK